MTEPIDFVSPMASLVAKVGLYFRSHGISTVVERGWKARNEQTNQGPGQANRVVFIPSKLDGSAGACKPPRQVGPRELGADPSASPPVPAAYLVRALSDWDRQCLVSVWAYDATNPNDEGLQDDAAWRLFTETQRAVHAATLGNGVWGAVKISVPAERAFGVEYLAELSFQTMVPDVPEELTRPRAVVAREGQ